MTDHDIALLFMAIGFIATAAGAVETGRALARLLIRWTDRHYPR